jgi:protein-disulfide isomerase
MKHLFFAAMALIMTAVPAQAQELNRAEVEAIVRDYLLTNPEIMLEVQQALDVKQREQAQARARDAIAGNADLVFNSPNQGIIGNPNGDVTIVEFFDYNCGFCQRAMADMNALLESDDNVRFVMKELPILGPGSVEASQVSTAVYRLYPNRYGEFHNALLSENGAKDRATALGVAGLMGLDLDRIEEEAAKEDVIDAFREANALATELGVTGTPSYVVGNEVVYGARGVEVLRDHVANIRECGEASCS